MAKNKKMEETIQMDSNKKTKKKVPFGNLNLEVNSLKSVSKAIETIKASMVKSTLEDLHVQKKVLSIGIPTKEETTRKKTKTVDNNTKTPATRKISEEVLPVEKKTVKEKVNTPAPKVPKKGTSNIEIGKTKTPRIENNLTSKLNKRNMNRDNKNLQKDKKPKVTMASSSKKTGDAINNNVKRKNKSSVSGFEDMIQIMEKIEKGIRKNNQLLKTLIDLTTSNNKPVNTVIPATNDKYNVRNTTIDVIPTGTIATEKSTTPFNDPDIFTDILTPADVVKLSPLVVKTVNIAKVSTVAKKISSNDISTQTKKASPAVSTTNKSVEIEEVQQKIDKLQTLTENSSSTPTDNPKIVPATKQIQQNKSARSKIAVVNSVEQQVIHKPKTLPDNKPKIIIDNTSKIEVKNSSKSDQATSRNNVNKDKSKIVSKNYPETNITLSNNNPKLFTSFCFIVYFKRTKDENRLMEKVDKVTNYINSYIKNKTFLCSINKDFEKSPAILPIELETYRKDAKTTTYFKFNISRDCINDNNIGRIIENIQEKLYKAEEKGWLKSFVYAL